jgi:hypothetical protein
MAACGSSEPEAAEREATPQRPALARSSSTARRCQDQLGGLLRSLSTLRRRLAIGLTYDRYLYDVRKVNATYEAVPVDLLTLNCVIDVATPSERALNHYIDAVNIWGDCLATTGCDSSSVEPELQRKWQRASGLISVANRGS